MTKTGIVAGSLDPITNGHVWLIREACALMDRLWVAIGVNPAKTAFFEPTEREQLIDAVLTDALAPADYAKVRLVFLERELLINFAKQVDAEYIIRGIRNGADFDYEHQMQLVNRKICPQVQALYLIPPSDLTEVSSSTVKGLVGFNGWESAVERYVHPVVLAALREKQVRGRQRMG